MRTMPRICVRGLLGLLMLLAVLPAAVGAARADAPVRQTLVHDGRTRTYLLDVPDAVVRAGRRVPLVLVLHGGGGTAESAARMTGFGRLAAREGFIVAYPEGTARRGRLHTWNAGHCCGYAMRAGVDDIGFFAALIDHLVATQPIDADRVSVTGLSNGGMMAHRVGAALANRVAAVGPVIAALFGDEPLPPPGVSALIVNGALDRSVPPDGGPPGGRFPQAWDGTPPQPAAYQGTFWAKANRCDPTPRPHPADADPALAVWTYACPAGVEVVRYLVLDNGHAWPGGQRGSPRGDTPSRSLDATAVLWDFFRRQRRGD